MAMKFLLALIFHGAMVTASLAARHIDVEIVIDDEVVMTAPYSDDGRQNADQVWNTIKDVEFRMAEGADLILKKADSGEGLYEIDHVGTLYVQYGGQYEFKTMQLLRQNGSDGETIWKINPKQLTKWFDKRLIRRTDADGLISK